jgi:hypothetical protein
MMATPLSIRKRVKTFRYLLDKVLATGEQVHLVLITDGPARSLMQTHDIENRFAFHPAANKEKRNEHTAIRTHCKDLAIFLNEAMPEGREKSLATHLELVMFWGNAGTARDISNMAG